MFNKSLPGEDSEEHMDDTEIKALVQVNVSCIVYMHFLYFTGFHAFRLLIANIILRFLSEISL